MIEEKRTKATQETSQALTSGDAVHTICRRSGLPTVLVDEDEVLDPDQVQSFFEKQIIGQEEAVQCMVDRITLLKAGLTDTGRPLGVFFFAGPTGTGKTECAKVLADYLFGSKERRVRLDMSELQTADDLSRLFGVSASVGKAINKAAACST